MYSIWNVTRMQTILVLNAFPLPPPCTPPPPHPLWYQILVLPCPTFLPHFHHLTLLVSLWYNCSYFTAQQDHVLPSSLLPADIVKALSHQLDAKWRHFGTFLRVDYQTMESIETSKRGRPEDCMLDLLGRWTSNQAGTGTLPRTWQTIVEAMKETGFRAIAENLAHKHGLTLSQ